MEMPRFRELLPPYAVIFLGFLGYALTITLFIYMFNNQVLLRRIFFRCDYDFVAGYGDGCNFIIYWQKVV